MPPLGQIIQHHNVSFHCYADGTQIYFPLRPTDPKRLAAVVDCLNDLNCWMAQHFFSSITQIHIIQSPKPYQFNQECTPSVACMLIMVLMVMTSVVVVVLSCCYCCYSDTIYHFHRRQARDIGTTCDLSSLMY